MKKAATVTIMVLALGLFICGCNNEKYNANEKYYTEIKKLADFVSIYNSDSMHVTVIGQTTCGHCISHKKVMNRIAYENNLDIYWLEFDLLNEEDRKEFIALNERFEKFGTPLTLFTKNGEIVDEISGALEAPIILNKLKNLEIID